LFGSHDGRLTREDSPPSSAGTPAPRPADAMRRDKVEAVSDRAVRYRVVREGVRGPVEFALARRRGNSSGRRHAF